MKGLILTLLMGLLFASCFLDGSTARSGSPYIPRGPNPASEFPMLISQACLCENGLNYGELNRSCNDFCADGVDEELTTYLRLMPSKGSLGELCFTGSNPLDRTTPNPTNTSSPGDLNDDLSRVNACTLEVTYEKTQETEPVTLTLSRDAMVKADTSFLVLGESYTLKVKNVYTGDESPVVEFKTVRGQSSSVGDFRTLGMHRYACRVDTGGMRFHAGNNKDGHFQWMTFSQRFHFMYTDRGDFKTVPGDSSSVFCFDFLAQGPPILSDNAFFERLHLERNAFKLWNPTNQAFADPDGDGSTQFSDYLRNELFIRHGLEDPRVDGLFVPMTSPANGPCLNDENGLDNCTETLDAHGFYLLPFLSLRDNTRFCPVKEDYSNSSDELIRLLGEHIGDTQPLYMAESTKQLSTGSITDRIYITLSEVRPYLFKKSGNTRLAATNEEIADGIPMYFYYPLDPNDPIGRAVGPTEEPLIEGYFGDVPGPPASEVRKMYKIVYPGSESNVPGDKRMGCVPL